MAFPIMVGCSKFHVFIGQKKLIYHLVMTNIAMERSTIFHRVNHLFLWAMASMAMLNNQRVESHAFPKKT